MHDVPYQNLKISVYNQWSGTGSSADIIEKTVIDDYLISFAGGVLASKPNQSIQFNNDKSGDASAFTNFWTGVNDLVASVKNQSGNFLSASSKPIPFHDAQNFVFPGAKVCDGASSKLQSKFRALQSRKAFEETFAQLKALSFEFLHLTLSDVLVRLLGGITEAVLGSTQVVTDALFNVLHDVADAAVEMLDTLIHIPIILDILNAIGVPDLSCMDLITWIGASGVTILYKIIIINNKAPFPDNAHISSFIAFFGNFLFLAEAMDTSPTNTFGLPSASLAIISAVTAGAADVLVAKPPIKNTAVGVVNRTTTLLTVGARLLFSGLDQKYIARGRLAALKVDDENGQTDNRQVGAVVKTVSLLFWRCFARVGIFTN
ncbi:hypothetical protein T440DRAFT_554747 [Plenodomus tracheiphilus IPT5]|uniref:Uncharacterized protein n=1 Tax=Plenodomus tracheiphilus IPT5 TaxID=1408161 RepID=A0A6A7B681_9PLEO|nr:hypothetical protein T440DRAFT_554747 [Plenodomus tracheiphilus IPT5]